MIYKLIYSSKLKFHKAALNIFLVISYLTAFSGCMTTYHYSESPETISTIPADEITKIELIKGTVIDFKGKIVNYESGADSVKYIVVKTLTSTKDYKSFLNEKRIPEKDILKIHIEHSEVNDTKTVFFVAGIVVVICLAAFIAGLAKSNMNFGFGE